MAAAVVLPGCAPAASPVRVVAVTAATAAQPQPALGGAGSAAVRRAAESDRGSFTLLVAGEPGLTRSLDLVAHRDRGAATEVEYGPRRQGMIDALVADAAAAVADVAGTQGEADLLDVLALGAQGPPGTLLVLDGGVSAADPLDLRALDWAADPAAVVDDLRARDHLPDLRGWAVVFVGTGRTAGEQPALGLPQRRWLERLWLAICAGAQARSCAVEPSDAVPAAARSTRTVAPVPIPASTTAQLPDGSVQFTLPDARLGFSPGSAELSGEVAAVLAPVVDAARQAGDGCRVRVTGYVAFWGDEPYRAQLSQARAAAVAGWLSGNGVDAGSLVVVGAGAADGPDASYTDGRFDEQKVARNGVRRVVVMLDPVP